MSDEIPDIAPFGAYALVHIEREAKVGAIHIPDAAQALARAKVVRVGPDCKWAAVNTHVLPHPAAAMLHVPGAADFVLIEESGLLAQDDRSRVESARVIAEPASPLPKRKRVAGSWQ